MRLRRNKYNNVIFGVCGGIADTLGINPGGVRCATAIAALICPVTIPIYLVGAMLMDE